MMTTEEKAAKYDEIREAVDKYYSCDEEGNDVYPDADLCTIGEEVCGLLGYI